VVIYFYTIIFKPDELLQVYMYTRDDGFCSNIGVVDPMTELCAGNTAAVNGDIRAVCDQGDMGGPLVIKGNDNKYYAAGVLT
jgi:hypothetical protein